MKVCMLGMKGNFDRNIGRGVQINAQELYTHLKEKMGNKIEKAELGYGNAKINREVSFTALSLMNNFNKYSIVHMPIPIMANPRAKINVTTLYELYLLDEQNPLYTYEKTHFDSRKLNIVSTGIHKLIMNQILGSDYIMPISSQTEDEAIKCGYPKERIITITHAIEDEFTKGKIPTKKPSQKRFTLGYMGAMHPRKNPSSAIKAFKLVAEKNAAFEMWGRAKAGSEVTAAAADDKRISFKGFAPEKGKIKIYDRFDAVFVPTLYDGHSKPILEAMSRGKPVIIYEYAQIPKEVTKYCLKAKDDEHAAYMIEDLIRNGYKPKERERAMKYARSFTWDRVAAQTITAYEKIIRTSK